MTERTSIPPIDDTESTASDPDDGSTWSTIDGTAEINELVNEEVSKISSSNRSPIPSPTRLT